MNSQQEAMLYIAELQSDANKLREKFSKLSPDAQKQVVQYVTCVLQGQSIISLFKGKE